MPPVEGAPSPTDAWRKLHDKLEDKAKMQHITSGQRDSLNTVLAVSVNELGRWQRSHFLKLAVIASGILASKEMLLYLWEEVGENRFDQCHVCQRFRECTALRFVCSTRLCRLASAVSAVSSRNILLEQFVSLSAYLASGYSSHQTITRRTWRTQKLRRRTW